MTDTMVLRPPSRGQMKTYLQFGCSRALFARSPKLALMMAMRSITPANARAYFRDSGHMGAYDAQIERENGVCALLMALL